MDRNRHCTLVWLSAVLSVSVHLPISASVSDSQLLLLLPQVVLAARKTKLDSKRHQQLLASLNGGRAGRPDHSSTSSTATRHFTDNRLLCLPTTAASVGGLREPEMKQFGTD